MEKLLIAGLLLSTHAFALPNSHTFLINSSRANLSHIQPSIDCWRGKPMPIEIIRESDTSWKIEYETPERMVDCAITFTVGYGDINACEYDLHVSFTIGNGMAPDSPDFGLMSSEHTGKLNPASEPFSYCPGRMSSYTDWPRYQEKNMTNLYL